MSEKPIYCGSGKKQNDSWLKVTINPDKLKEYIQTYEGNNFVKLNINIKDKPDQYGKDVSISIDNWQPKKEVVAKHDSPYTAPEDLTDSLPF